MERPVLNVAEAAKLLGISRNHTYELIWRHQLPSVRLGRRVFVPRKALEAVLEAATIPVYIDEP